MLPSNLAEYERLSILKIPACMHVCLLVYFLCTFASMCACTLLHISIMHDCEAEKKFFKKMVFFSDSTRKKNIIVNRCINVRNLKIELSFGSWALHQPKLTL